MANDDYHHYLHVHLLCSQLIFHQYYSLGLGSMAKRIHLQAVLEWLSTSWMPFVSLNQKYQYTAC